MLAEHQQLGVQNEQEKKFFTLIGELVAAGCRRILKQESLLIARAGKSV